MKKTNELQLTVWNKSTTVTVELDLVAQMLLAIINSGDEQKDIAVTNIIMSNYNKTNISLSPIFKELLPGGGLDKATMDDDMPYPVKRIESLVEGCSVRVTGLNTSYVARVMSVITDTLGIVRRLKISYDKNVRTVNIDKIDFS